MKKFETPKISVRAFNVEDILTTSAIDPSQSDAPTESTSPIIPTLPPDEF